MSTSFRTALCCVCGTIRECRRPRSNHRPENYWFRGPIDLDWHRETGDLKCVECGHMTTHALLHPEGDQLRDHAERLQKIALGWSHSFADEKCRQNIMRKYREGIPRNPFLRHHYWLKDADAARSARLETMTAICGDTMNTPKPKPKSSESVDYDEMIDPGPMPDQEYEDSITGLWWVDMPCPNCTALANAITLRDLRKRLFHRLVKITGSTDDLDYQTVDKLLSTLDEIETDAKAKGAADAP